MSATMCAASKVESLLQGRIRDIDAELRPEDIEGGETGRSHVVVAHEGQSPRQPR
jgi:hypothetical protein